MATVEWEARANSDLSKIPKRDAIRVRDTIDRVAANQHRKVQRLRGFRKATHRVRVGVWRAVIRREGSVVRVLRIRHRRNAYRKASRIRQGLFGSEDAALIALDENSAGDDDLS